MKSVRTECGEILLICTIKQLVSLRNLKFTIFFSTKCFTTFVIRVSDSYRSQKYNFLSFQRVITLIFLWIMEVKLKLTCHSARYVHYSYFNLFIVICIILYIIYIYLFVFSLFFSNLYLLKWIFVTMFISHNDRIYMVVLIFNTIKYIKKIVCFLLCMFSFFLTSNIHFLLPSRHFSLKTILHEFYCEKYFSKLDFFGACLEFLTYLLFPLNFLNLKCLPSRNLLLQNQQWKHQCNVFEQISLVTLILPLLTFNK